MSEKFEKPIRKPPPPYIYNPPKGDTEIILKDAHIIVVSKPSGLLSVPGRKEEHADSLITRIQEKYSDSKIVHRLDMDTSGLMILALNKEAHRNLSLQFERRETKKTYIAELWGGIDDDQGSINLPLICDWPNRPLQMVDFDQGKSAQTNWEVISRDMRRGTTRVALYPVTGRTHQLRVHMAEIDHPILGDDFYAHEAAFKAEDRLMLHAHKLMVRHPVSGEDIWFEAPMPF